MVIQAKKLELVTQTYGRGWSVKPIAEPLDANQIVENTRGLFFFFFCLPCHTLSLHSFSNANFLKIRTSWPDINLPFRVLSIDFSTIPQLFSVCHHQQLLSFIIFVIVVTLAESNTIVSCNSVNELTFSLKVRCHASLINNNAVFLPSLHE